MVARRPALLKNIASVRYTLVVGKSTLAPEASPLTMMTPRTAQRLARWLVGHEPRDLPAAVTGGGGA